MVISTKIRLPELFDFHLTVGHQTHFRGRNGADIYQDGVYYRVLRRDARVIVASAHPEGGNLSVRVVDGREEDLPFACDAMSWLLALDMDLTGFYALLANDPILSDAVGTLRGLRPPRTESVFEALIVAIVGQQISANVARVIREGLIETYGTPIEAEGRLMHAFPTPESLLGAGTEALRAGKLSARKVEYVLDAARREIDGELDAARFDGVDNEEVIAELIKVRGIGRWTAEWVLLRALGRADVFPAGDLALKRVVSELYFNGAPMTESELAAFGRERWAPYRGSLPRTCSRYCGNSACSREAPRQRRPARPTQAGDEIHF